MKIYRLISIVSEILTLLIGVYFITQYREQSGSGVFMLWTVSSLILLGLSHMAYFTEKWKYTVPILFGGFLIVLGKDIDFVPVVIFSALLGIYSIICRAHWRIRCNKHQ